MDINLGTKIRELRKDKGLTQEDLADKLSVSAQAVSKWENDTCYPDMAQIPVLANFFGVSLDELFCYDVTQLNAKIDAIITEARNYFWSNRDKCEEILLGGLKEYPDNERIRAELMDLYLSRGNENMSDEEFISFAKQLADDTKDVFLKCRAKDVIVCMYSRQNRYDEMKALIDTLPVMYPYMLCDKMRSTAYHLKGEDRLKWAKDWKLIEIQELYIACSQEGKGYWETGAYEKALESFGQYRRIIEMFMKSDEIAEENYLWGGMQTHHWCSYLKEAGCLVKLGYTDEAKAKIERAYYIISHAWGDEFEKNTEEIMKSFRQYYSEWELDAIEPCPW